VTQKDRTLNALLGRGANYEGQLSFEGRVRVDGCFRGQIYTDESLEVGESGTIFGEVDAQDLTVAGQIEGKVKVRGLLVVESTGCIQGEIDAAKMVTRKGATLRATIIVGQ
jgi:cytoskeletal protein CcmA (bactofilin family)